MMRASHDLSSILAEARRRAILRRQLYCTSEQVLESILLDAHEAPAANAVSEHLDVLKKLPFDPPFVEDSRNFSNRVLPAASAHAEHEGSENIKPEHLAEAIQYRRLDRNAAL